MNCYRFHAKRVTCIGEEGRGEVLDTEVDGEESEHRASEDVFYCGTVRGRGRLENWCEDDWIETGVAYTTGRQVSPESFVLSGYFLSACGGTTLISCFCSHLFLVLEVVFLLAHPPEPEGIWYIAFICVSSELLPKSRLQFYAKLQNQRALLTCLVSASHSRQSRIGRLASSFQALQHWAMYRIPAGRSSTARRHCCWDEKRNIRHSRSRCLSYLAIDELGWPTYAPAGSCFFFFFADITP